MSNTPAYERAVPPTANFSHLSVEGTQPWIAAVTDRVIGVLEHKKNNRRFLHQPLVYDLGLMAFGVPLGLYLCWKFSGVVTSVLGNTHTIVLAAAYIYILMAALWAYRFLFGYAKWAFPTIELEDDKSKTARHRKVWYVLVAGVLGNFLTDLVKWLYA